MLSIGKKYLCRAKRPSEQNGDLIKMDAQKQWLDSLKSDRTRTEYEDRFAIWLTYCKLRQIPETANAQIEDIKKRRLSNDNTVKFFYNNEITKFFKWLKTEYKGKRNKPFSEGSALAITTAIRSFFAHHRYPLDVKDLPSSEHVKAEFSNRYRKKTDELMRT